VGWFVVLFVIVGAAWIAAICYELAKPGKLNWNQPYWWLPRKAAEDRRVLRDDAEPLPVHDDIEPLAYPGRRPDRPAVLLSGRSVLRVHPSAGPVGSWPTGRGLGTPLDDVLARAGAARLAHRSAVLAVGSSAAPAWLAATFRRAGLRPAVPMLAAAASGIIAGVSAHVSARGYLPATPVAKEGATGAVWVIWLDRSELQVMDEAEPEYRRIGLPARFQVTLTGGRVIQDCWIYVSRHGFLTDRSAQPRGLTGQAALITSLLEDVPALPGIAGSSPQEWVQRASELAVRDRIQAELARSGLVGRLPELAG
jgi:hypothetical protein